MSVTSNGSKGEPQFASTGNSPTFSDDLTSVADYAGVVGNRIADTHAHRTAFTPTGVDADFFADGPWDGLAWYETDTGIPYLYNAATVSWVRLGGKTVDYATGAASGGIANSTAQTFATSSAPVVVPTGGSVLVSVTASVFIYAGGIAAGQVSVLADTTLKRQRRWHNHSHAGGLYVPVKADFYLGAGATPINLQVTCENASVEVWDVELETVIG